mgnify:CR=1 FL=1
MENITYIALSDVTPNRGRIEYVGPDEDAAQDAIDAAGRVYTVHPDGSGPLAIGARAYHDDDGHAWVDVFKYEADGSVTRQKS